MIEIVGVLAIALSPLLLLRAWGVCFPGLSLSADYGVRGGWFGCPVTLTGASTTSGASWSR